MEFDHEQEYASSELQKPCVEESKGKMKTKKITLFT